MDCPTPRPRRQAVLVVIHVDGFLEAFAEKNIDVAFARQLDFNTPRGERIADECFEMLLPRRYRDLWRRDYLRANGTTDLLTADAVLDALHVRDIIAAYPPAEDAKGAA
jgi:hypothetical protein